MNYEVIREIASQVTLEMMDEGLADQGEIAGLLHAWICAFYEAEEDPEVDRIIHEVVSTSLN